MSVSELFLSPQGSLVNLNRRAHEDRYKISLLNGNTRMYAVFDGHGGSQVADYLKENLDKILAESLQGVNLDDPEKVRSRIYKGFRWIDYLMFTLNMEGGSTAGLILITNKHIYLISLGDSTSILYDQGRILAVSKDCKPGDDSEMRRIQGLGGFITYDPIPRVHGILAVSRAFGDFVLKRAVGINGYVAEGWVTVIPEINVLIRPSRGSLLVASDGLWDAFKPEQVSMAPQTSTKCEMLAYLAAQLTTDDITIIDDVL